MTWLAFPSCGKRPVVSISFLGYRGDCKDPTLLSSFRPTASVSANSVFEVGVVEACVFLFQCLLGSKTHGKHGCDSIIINEVNRIRGDPSLFCLELGSSIFRPCAATFAANQQRHDRLDHTWRFIRERGNCQCGRDAKACIALHWSILVLGVHLLFKLL